MMNTGIPEISSVENIEYLRETLVPQLGEEDALQHFRGKFQEALKNSIWAKINFALHNARRNQNMWFGEILQEEYSITYIPVIRIVPS